MRRVPSASPRVRGVVGLAAVLASVALVARVASLGVDRGGALTFAGAIGIVAVILAATALPRASAAAAGILLLLPVPTLASERTRDVAVELAVLAVLSVELTAWAADLRSRIRETSATVARRTVEVAAAVVGTAAVGSLALGATALGGPHGRAALVIGLAALTAAVALLAWRVRAGDPARS
jgi:hypothetical protein